MPTPPVTPRRVLLILNPLSRAGPAPLEAALRRFSDAGVQVRSILAEQPARIPGLIRQSCGEIDCVVVAGGDGSFNTAAPALLDCGLPLGILPTGTANDLARTLHIPTDLGAAAEIVIAGVRHAIDLGQVNDIYFFNTASMGLSVQVARRVSRPLKQRWGLLAYARGAVAEYRRKRPFLARIVSGQEHLRLSSIQLAVGNGRFYGGGTPVDQRAEIDDGELYLYSLPPLPWWRLAALLPSLRRGEQGGHPEVLVLHGKEITVETRPQLEIDTDGELTTHTPAHFRVLPRALEVFVPESYPKSRHAAQ